MGMLSMYYVYFSHPLSRMRLPWQRHSLIHAPPCAIQRVPSRRVTPPPVYFPPTTTGIHMEYGGLCAPPLGPPCSVSTQFFKGLPCFESCMPSHPSVPGFMSLQKALVAPPPPPIWIVDKPVPIREHLAAKSPAVRKKVATPPERSLEPGSRAAKIQGFVSTHFK